MIGAEGDVGQAAHAELAQRHEIITVGRSNADIRADMTDRASLDEMYRKVGPVDAVVSAAGSVHFGPLIEFTLLRLFAI